MFHAELGEGETKTNEGLPTFSGSPAGSRTVEAPQTNRERERMCAFSFCDVLCLHLLFFLRQKHAGETKSERLGSPQSV